MAKDIRCFCNTCRNENNHRLLKDETFSQIEKYGKGYEETYWQVYQIVQCSGCDSVSFRLVFASTEDIDPETGTLNEGVYLFPVRDKFDVRLDFSCIPRSTRKVLRETLKAVNNECKILAGIGLRVIVESICAELEIKASNLEKKIDLLIEKGFASIKQGEQLHFLRDLGNKAAHEINEPTNEELSIAYEIIEAMLKVMYEFDERRGSQS